jgi:hypothetical protein
MSAQRAPIPEEQKQLRTALWQPPPPEVEGVGRPPPVWAAQEGDTYVVVDDLDEDLARLVLSVWPRLDRAGRLVFRLPSGDTRTQNAWRSILELVLPAADRPLISADAQPYEVTLPVPRDSFQRAVNRARAGAGQLGGSRELRMGDVFRVRSLRSPDVSEWEDVLDVTAPARDAAKAALLAAAAPKITSAADVELEAATPSGEDQGSRRRPPGAIAASSV